MNKSKILIPAFAVLALSVGASVTGTVAWFTANRSQSFSTAFSVVDGEGALKIKLSNNANAGTKMNGEAVEVDGVLTHGSYDAKATKDGSLYFANLHNDGNTGENVGDKYVIDSYSSLGAIPEESSTGIEGQKKWLAGTKLVDAKDTESVWYGVSWTATFSVEASSITGTNHLFLDIGKSTIGKADKANLGLRVAVMGENKLYVLGANSAEGADKHVTGTDKNNVGNFGNDYFSFGSEQTKGIDDAASYENIKGYIGKFPTTGEDKNIKLTFVAWFEGEDSNVISGNADALASVSATLSFYARRTTKILN